MFNEDQRNDLMLVAAIKKQRADARTIRLYWILRNRDLKDASLRVPLFRRER